MLVGTCRSVAAKSGHGTGKTSCFAWLVLWFLTVWAEARVVCTAPTQRQLLDVLWPEIQKWLDRSALKGRLFWYTTRITAAGHEKTWFATARTSNRPENMQGFHAEHVLVLIDEASGIPQPTMEAIEGVQTTANCKIAMGGNPTRISGMFYDAFHKMRAFYATLTMSSEKSTNVTDEYCERLAAKYGRDSNVYRVRVLGQFPRGEPDVLIDLDLVEAAIVNEVEPEGLVAIGCDPARYGDAETTIYWRQGYRVYPPIVRQGISTSWTTGEIAALVRRIRADLKYNGRIPVMVDETGIGAGVVDQLELQAHELWIEVVPVNFGGAGDEEYTDTASLMLGTIKDALPLMQLP
ncbi:MAG: terminase B, partial [Phycisphaerae bacterium]|nr:terminase B [Phycisphaerae bacterium]